MILITTVLKDHQIKIPNFLLSELSLKVGDVVEIDLGEVKKVNMTNERKDK